VSEQLGFPYRRDLRHPRARRKALRGPGPTPGRRLAALGVAPGRARGGACRGACCGARRGAGRRA